MARKAQRSYHHGDLAKALVRAALTLVERDGVEAFSLREATLMCDVVVSSAYRHFPSKDALLHAVADIGFAALADAMEAELRAATAKLRGTRGAEAALVATGRSYIRFAVARPNLFRLMYGPHGPRGGGRDPRSDAPAHRISQMLVQALQDVLAAYHNKDASLGRNKVIAWAAVHGFAMMVIDGIWPPQGEAALAATIEALGQAVLRSLR
jgi:AcrR family transcriptional regulator